MLSYKVDFEIKGGLIKKAIEVIDEFVTLVHANEKDTISYHAFQGTESPSNFTHYMIFKNVAAEELHRNSEYCLKFVNSLYPMCLIEPVFIRLNYIK